MEEKKKEIRYVGVKENLLFALANGGQCFSYNMFTGSYLSLFFVRVFGIPTGAVATMLLVLGIWDTINDPIMGGIVDKTHTRYGKLRPWLLIVPIPLAISTILFWGGPLLLQNTREMTIKIVYMYLSYLLWEFFYTLGDVPYWSLSAAISPSPSDRTRAIASARLLSGVIGGVATTLLLPVMIDLSNNGKSPGRSKRCSRFAARCRPSLSSGCSAWRVCLSKSVLCSRWRRPAFLTRLNSSAKTSRCCSSF